MCLAYPMKVVSIEGDYAFCEISNIKRKVGIQLLGDIKVGDYVMVHAGFAIEKVEPREALKTLSVFREYTDALRRSIKE